MRKALRAARANRVFCADEKRIRTENTVIDKGKGGSVWLLFKIADCARMAFYPCTIGDPRGRFHVRAGLEKTCALRAPTVISVRIKNIRTEITVLVNTERRAIGFVA